MTGTAEVQRRLDVQRALDKADRYIGAAGAAQMHSSHGDAGADNGSVQAAAAAAAAARLSHGHSRNRGRSRGGNRSYIRSQIKREGRAAAGVTSVRRGTWLGLWLAGAEATTRMTTEPSIHFEGLPGVIYQGLTG